MKRVGLIMLMLVPSVALAQQPPDGALAVCQQLLTNANAQTIQVGAQVAVLGRQLEEARAELAKLKAPPTPESKP